MMEHPERVRLHPEGKIARAAGKPNPFVLPFLVSLTIFLAMLMAGSGCATTKKGYSDRSPRLDRFTEVQEPLHSPHHFKSDFSYPIMDTYQALTWDSNGCEWKVQVPTIPDALAGVVFRRAYDFSQDRNQKWLTFKLKPAAMDKHISVGLIDNGDQFHGFRLDKPLADYKIKQVGDWGYYSICMDEFASAHAALNDLPSELQGQALDWKNIRGILLSRVAEQGPSLLVIIRNLYFETASLVASHG